MVYDVTSHLTSSLDNECFGTTQSAQQQARAAKSSDLWPISNLQIIDVWFYTGTLIWLSNNPMSVGFSKKIMTYKKLQKSRVKTNE